jgi:hypothetical protein
MLHVQGIWIGVNDFVRYDRLVKIREMSMACLFARWGGLVDLELTLGLPIVTHGCPVGL